MDEYKNGEEVFLIHSRQYAWIVERRDDETWVVDLDGDLIPVHVDDMVPAKEADWAEEESVDAGSAGTSAAEASPGGQPETSVAEGFAQVFVPLGQGRYQRWLVNGTPQTFRILVEQSDQQVAAADMPPNAKLDLGPMHRDDLHEQAAMTLTCRYTEGPHKIERSFQKDLRIRVAAFAKREAAATAARGAAAAARGAAAAGQAGAVAAPLIFSVFQQPPGGAADFSTYSPPDLEQLGQGRKKGSAGPGGTGQGGAQRGRAGREALPPELDLHIEKLVEHPEKLHPAEMLAVQLARATQYLDRAAWSGMHKVYLIHGLGTGRLREELHDMLRRHPRVKGFQNSHFPRYGFGATEVVLDH
ncbi:MAG: hypothetical protein GC205_03485 [Bacteroidetes bacterium]|nr:hypothetical protein [Bacteroidota bacterium]